MNGETREGYARLPEDLLRDLLIDADHVVDQVHGLLTPAIERRDEFRDALHALNLIRTYTPSEVQTISGIDGGFAVERTAAVDLILCVAVGVEGLAKGTTEWEGTQYDWWTRVAKHDSQADRLARGVMTAQELSVLAQAPHQLRILDGSHLTLVIQLNSALSAESDDVRAEARKLWERSRTADALSEATRSEAIVAMPKYDSSAEIIGRLSKRLGEEIPGDDKHLMGLLLEPGELLTPQPVPEAWSRLHFTAREGSGDEDLQEALTAAIEPLKERGIKFTYFKPDVFSPAFRIELKASMDNAQLDSLCTTIARQITGPFVREPYPQYLADVMAKSVGLGLSALQSAVQLGLSERGRPEIAQMLIHSYRTEGV
jgi:hypothetical protein